MAKAIAHFNGVDYELDGEHDANSVAAKAENYKLKTGPLTIHVRTPEGSAPVDIRRELIWSSSVRLA